MTEQRDTQPPKGEPERRCLVTRAARPTAEMVRYVVGPEGRIVPDIEGKLPGRGLWLTADGAVIDEAVARKRFKGAGGEAPSDLRAQTARLMRERILSLIGLARRSGDLVAGFDAIERAAAKGADIAFLVEASDGAPDGKRKLRGKFRNRPGSLTGYDIFDQAALSRATGRENTIHLGLKRSRLADKIQLEMTRLAGIEGITGRETS